ncbi:MAG: hypothetical protein CVV27_18235 [Candidatus Melainabacteria bacterium HGW-Melainabacteria-1]|nr:MAG: hypothetical protein CVV27_18235 [Candidatus Melainabacteria bacterium HGW-Melainabacteria-1]
MWKNFKPHGLLATLSLFAMLCLIACAGGHELSAEVSQMGKDLQVKGQSNLPDQALILVSLLDPAKPDEMNRNVIVQEFAPLKAGAFSATLKPMTPVPAGKYLLRLRFRPPAPSMPTQGEVLAAVGPNGEKLSGPRVVSDGDAKMLVHQQEIEYKP